MVWDYLDDAYVSAGPYQRNINEAFVRLGVEYVEYLQGGGSPLSDVTAKYTADGADAGSNPDRLQPLHDNLLGNLSSAALAQRFSGNPTLHRLTLTNLVTASMPTCCHGPTSRATRRPIRPRPAPSTSPTATCRRRRARSMPTTSTTARA